MEQRDRRHVLIEQRNEFAFKVRELGRKVLTHKAKDSVPFVVFRMDDVPINAQINQSIKCCGFFLCAAEDTDDFTVGFDFHSVPPDRTSQSLLKINGFIPTLFYLFTNIKTPDS